ncbi:MAG: hypothetical protein ACI4VS_02125 [Candidatus Nanosyncoccaceae bacterium]
MTFFKNHKKQSSKEQGEAPQNGGRNLCILGICALIVAIITTSISLKIYHDTGDVYLDRSRPGFISDEEKHHTEKNIKETFSEDGEIDVKVLDEYLQKLEQMRKKSDDYIKDFATDPLSDHQLGIEATDESEDSSEVEDQVE